MPIYQYDCAGCGRRVDVFFRSISNVGKPVCPACGGEELKRVMSKVARSRSAAERVGSIDINQELGRVDSRDPASFARWARRMGREYDGELGSDFTEIADRADAGADPVERADVAHSLRYRVEQAKHGERPSSEDMGDA